LLIRLEDCLGGGGSQAEDVVRVILASPVRPSDIAGAFKILCHGNYHIENLLPLLRQATRFSYNSHQVFLNLVIIPEVTSALNLDLARRFSHPVPVRLNFGAVVYGFLWDFFITDFVRRHGVWEPETQAAIREHLRPGDVAVDVGANIGCHTALMAQIVGSAGSVFAFEPVGAYYRLLRDMIQLNGLNNVVTVRAAVSDRAGTVPLAVHAVNIGGSSIIESAHAGEALGDETEYAPTVVLDDFFAERTVHFIKLDVEGHEHVLLNGAWKLIERCRPKIIMELAPANLRQKGADPEDLIERFRRLGYGFSIVGNPERLATVTDLIAFIEERAPYMEIVLLPQG
jgi:FkbM family methyltransferase